MTASLHALSDLSEEQRSAWDAAVRGGVTLDSPYFTRAYCEAVDAAKGGVEVVAVSEGGRTVALLPLERDGRAGYPVGRVLNDYQAVIAADDAVYDPAEMLAAAGLKSLHLDHLLASQAAFADYHERADCSPYLSVAGGEEAYLKTVGKSGRNLYRTAQRKARKMEREVGPLSLTFQDPDPAALDALYEWKGQQYADTGLPNVLEADWTHDLFGRLLASEDDDCRGVLTTLRAGDRLAAVHMGMTSGGVYHWWFPTYCEELSAYSPGMALLAGLVERAEEFGVAKIDLGKGMADYKRRLMSGGVPLAEAIVQRPGVARSARRAATAAKEWLKTTPLKPALAAPARWVYHLRTRRALR